MENIIEDVKEEPTDKYYSSDSDTIIKENKLYFDIVLNKCYGGFSISDFGKNLLKENNIDSYDDVELRKNRTFITLIEEHGDLMNGKHAKLKIKKIPIKYEKFIEIEEYDGMENINWHVTTVLYKEEQYKKQIEKLTEENKKLQEELIKEKLKYEALIIKYNIVE